MKAMILIGSAATAAMCGSALAAGTITNDTSEHFRVVWGWNPEGFMQEAAIGTYWDGFITIHEFGLVVPDRWTVSFDFVHKIPPHGEGPSAVFTSNSYHFSDDAVGVVFHEIGHVPHDGHRDDWRFIFNRSNDPANTEIVLNIVHNVPAPPALMCPAVFGALLGVRRRR